MQDQAGGVDEEVVFRAGLAAVGRAAGHLGRFEQPDHGLDEHEGADGEQQRGLTCRCDHEPAGALWSGMPGRQHQGGDRQAQPGDVG